MISILKQVSNSAYEYHPDIMKFGLKSGVLCWFEHN